MKILNNNTANAEVYMSGAENRHVKSLIENRCAQTHCSEAQQKNLNVLPRFNSKDFFLSLGFILLLCGFDTTAFKPNFVFIALSNPSVPKGVAVKRSSDVHSF